MRLRWRFHRLMLAQSLSFYQDEFAGRVAARGGTRIGYLDQSDVLNDSHTVGYALVGDTPEYEWASQPRIRDVIAGLVSDLPWDAPVSSLSGGQRKRAFVARAIAQGARLLLLDEPFAGVDKRSESMLIQVLKQMRSEGATVLVSTHDLASLRAFADDALLLRQTILMHDTPQAVLAPENLVQAFGMQVQAGADSGASDEQTRREKGE